jgi:ATP-dependent Lon protease
MNFEGILRFCPQAYRLLKGSRHLFGKIFGITATFGGVRASTTTNKKSLTWEGNVREGMTSSIHIGVTVVKTRFDNSNEKNSGH